MSEAKQNVSNTEEVEDLGGYAPAKQFCPHIESALVIPDNRNVFPAINEPIECSINNCDKKENWICLKCHNVFCGRYGNKHMINHFETDTNEKHCISMSVSDLSFWCYKCDSYLHHLSIKNIFDIYKIAYFKKFGEQIPTDVANSRYSFQFPLIVTDSKLCQYMNWGGFCMFFVLLFAEKKPAKETIRHEMIHYYQWKELLIIPFIVMYFIFLIYGLFKYGDYKRAYCCHPFEVEATLNERDLTYLKRRKYFSWINCIGMEISEEMIHYKN
eukprot:220278_1